MIQHGMRGPVEGSVVMVDDALLRAAEGRKEIVSKQGIGRNGCNIF